MSEKQLIFHRENYIGKGSKADGLKAPELNYFLTFFEADSPFSSVSCARAF
jgi:hypothetical protein